MKKSFFIGGVLAIIISCLIACTNVINDEDIANVSYNVKVDSEKSGFVDDFLSMKLAIIPEDEKLESKYVFKYTILEGQGKFIDGNGKDIQENNEVSLDSNSLNINYVGSKSGINIVKITISSNFEITKEATIKFEIKVPIEKGTLITEFLIGETKGVITDSNISIVLPKNTVLTNLTPLIAISDKATIDPPSGKALDFTNPVKYTVTAEDGITKSQYTVTAQVKTIAVEKITLSGDKELLVGEEHTLIAEISPDNATNKTINWLSSNPAIASVDTTGKVTAKAAGSAVITASSEDGELKATATITVKLPLSTEVKLFNFKIGSTQGVFSGNTINITIPSIGDGVSSLSPTFEISPKASVNVKSGVARDFSAPQTYVVTAENGIAKATYTVIVKIKVTGVGISFPMGPITLDIGKNQSLTTKVFPLDATNQNLTFKSSNTTIASVNSSGVVSAKAAGNAKITVTTVDGGFTDSIDVNVKPEIIIIAVTGINLLSNNTKIINAVGDSFIVTANILPKNATNKAVTWSSDNPFIANVDGKGKVTANAKGTANITATTKDGGLKKSLQVVVGDLDIVPR